MTNETESLPRTRARILEKFATAKKNRRGRAVVKMVSGGGAGDVLRVYRVRVGRCGGGVGGGGRTRGVGCSRPRAYPVGYSADYVARAAAAAIGLRAGN